MSKYVLSHLKYNSPDCLERFRKLYNKIKDQGYSVDDLNGILELNAEQLDIVKEFIKDSRLDVTLNIVENN